MSEAVCAIADETNLDVEGRGRDRESLTFWARWQCGFICADRPRGERLGSVARKIQRPRISLPGVPALDDCLECNGLALTGTSLRSSAGSDDIHRFVRPCLTRALPVQQGEKTNDEADNDRDLRSWLRPHGKSLRSRYHDLRSAPPQRTERKRCKFACREPLAPTLVHQSSILVAHSVISSQSRRRRRSPTSPDRSPARSGPRA